MTAILDALQIGTIAEIARQAQTTIRAMELERPATLMARYKSEAQAAHRAMELERPELQMPDFTNHVSEMASQGSAAHLSDVASQESVVSHSQKTEDADLAAEVQNCAIELLALQIEEDLPEWLSSNRSALAWEMALAAHEFIVGFMRIAARSPGLYTPNSSALNPLFMLLPRH